MSSKPQSEDRLGYRARRVTSVALAVFCLAVLGDVAGFDELLDERVGRPAAFLLRERLGLGPKVDARLKVVVLDDVAVRNQQLTELSLNAWGYLFTGLARERPSAILVDKVFETPLRTTDAEAFVSSVKGLDVPVVVGSFARASEIKGRPTLSLGRPEFQANAYLNDGDSTFAARAPGDVFAYGPNPKFIDAFSKVGHIRLESEMRYRAFLAPEDGVLIPHLAFAVAGDVKVEDDVLIVDGRRVRLDSEGRFTTNLFKPEALARQSLRLDTVVDAIAKKEDIPEFGPGDVILILPNAFTGGADFKDTPFGPMPGGVLLASTVNSVLSGRWLTEVPPLAERAGLLGLIVLGAWLGSFIPLIYSVALGAVLLLIVGACGVGSFVTFGLVWSWLWLGGFAAVAICSTAIDRSRMTTRYGQRLAEALGGSISPGDIQELLRNPQKLDLQPRSRRVTLMFIDLVGFSKLAESRPADELFKQLKEVLGEIRQIIYRHNGFIDRSLGDGLLCYFGFRYDSAIETLGHEDEALACAIELQRRNLQLSLDAKRRDTVSYPMRIGVNTDVICMGDLGDAQKIDFTVIGHGVNFAKRLETACDHFRIMLSPSTREGLTPSKHDEGALHSRFVQIKHHTELMPAFEYDPLAADVGGKVEALQHYWSHVGVKRKETRFQVGRRIELSLLSPAASGRVVNFSLGGLSLLMDRYIACGATFAFEIDDGTGTLRDRCRARGILPLEAEVKWGDVTAGGYLHGVALKSMSDDARQWFYEEMTKHANSAAG